MLENQVSTGNSKSPNKEKFGTGKSSQNVFLKRKQVLEIINRSRSYLYLIMTKGSDYYDETFPLPIDLSGGGKRGSVKVWVKAEIYAWVEAKIAKRGVKE